MSAGGNRIAIAPRDVAAAAITAAVARGAWSIGLTMLVLAVVPLVDLMIAIDRTDVIGPALAWIAGSIVLLTLLLVRPSRVTAVAYLVGGSVCATGWAYTLLDTSVDLETTGVFLLNRPASALALVGAVSSSLLGGTGWVLCGTVLGVLSMVAAETMRDAPIMVGLGPLFFGGVYLAILLALALIRRSQRGRVPDVVALELAAAQLSREREIEQRTVAVIHDTVLGDLAALQVAPATLSSRDRNRILGDLDAFDAAIAGVETAPQPPPEARDTSLADLVDDFQWRGLTVHVTGTATVLDDVDDAARDAVVWAVRACLENVLRHSGGEAAELFLEATDDEATIMVVDHGVGFDPHAVGPDRLGLRASITGRVVAAGGSVRVFSRPGAGTSVVLAVPRGAGEPDAVA